MTTVILNGCAANNRAALSTSLSYPFENFLPFAFQTLSSLCSTESCYIEVAFQTHKTPFFLSSLRHQKKAAAKCC